MPVVRKLTESEVRTLERKRLGVRRAIEQEYDRYLADFAPGDYGEVTLDEGDNRLTVRNRLKAAAARHDPPLTLAFQRTRGNLLRFYVEAAESVPAKNGVAAARTEARPSAEAASAPKRRGRAAKQANGQEAASAAPKNGRRRRRNTAES
ncbi:MAG: hypothetical protein DIU80_012730 [Chloroflexota bacterium]